MWSLPYFFGFAFMHLLYPQLLLLGMDFATMKTIIADVDGTVVVSMQYERPTSTELILIFIMYTSSSAFILLRSLSTTLANLEDGPAL